MIVVMSKPDLFAAEVEAERVLWAPNWFVSIPAFAKTHLTHLPMVSFETALCGLTKLMSWVSSPLRGFVGTTYSCRHSTIHSPGSLKYAWKTRSCTCVPGLVCFTGLEMENEQLDSVKVIYLISSRCIVWIRWPDSNINSIMSFQESSFNDNFRTCSNLRKNSNTTLMSQVLLYFGKEGLLSNTPFINLTTKGWLPVGVFIRKNNDSWQCTPSCVQAAISNARMKKFSQKFNNICYSWLQGITRLFSWKLIPSCKVGPVLFLCWFLPWWHDNVNSLLWKSLTL